MWRIKKEWVGKIAIKKITLGRQGIPIEDSVRWKTRWSEEGEGK